jgi:signal peptidase II
MRLSTVINLPAIIAGVFKPRRKVGLAWFLAIVLLTVVLDQVSKWLVFFLIQHHPPIVIIPNFLNLSYATNTGAAFSMFAGHTGLLAVFSGLISLVIAIWAWRLPPHEQGLRIPLGLILGGALGNLIDRALLGYVIDFIDAHWFDAYRWPTFNIADSAVCVGMFILIVASFTAPQGETSETEADKPKMSTDHSRSH